MMPEEELARAQLRARQGAGARYDDPAAPHDDLALARRGTAYFARLLANLHDRQLDDLSATPGLGRRHIIAQVGLEARLLAEAVASVRTAQGEALAFDIDPTLGEVEFTATLPSQALRNLFSHSEVHLNVEWRDLASDGWAAAVIDRTGKHVSIAGTPRRRALSLWQRAFQLRAGARQADFPTGLGEFDV